MSKKIVNLNEMRRKKRPRSLEEVAEAAVRKFFDPEILASYDEPASFAIGKSNADGDFDFTDYDEMDAEIEDDEEDKDAKDVK